jgi:hypothetical protein
MLMGLLKSFNYLNTFILVKDSKKGISLMISKDFIDIIKKRQIFFIFDNKICKIQAQLTRVHDHSLSNAPYF